MKVRRATARDAAIIGQIRIRGWRAAYRGVLPDAMLDALTDDDRLANRRSRLRHPLPRSGALVVEERGAVVGFVLTGPTRDQDANPLVTGELFAIYLEPDRIGCGLGRALIEAAEDDLREMGYRRASLWVLRDNARARRFYEAAGWIADGADQIEEMDGAVLDEVRYVRDLWEPAGTGCV